MRLKNPILPGFYPDPSVCRRGEDYYLISSTFEYFPGIPVFHSRDFVHWRQLGHVLTRPEQLDLTGVHASKGIYASTIRYREQDGYFYVVTTLVQDPPYWGNVNFYVRAKDPAGPWSDPVVIQGAEGIDPTLFFDGEKTYYLGNLRPYPDRKVTLERNIWLQELELETGRLVGERHILRTDGALYGAATPEGPHLYRIDGVYYLLIAEGGTSLDHSVTVFRSQSVFGPYEGNPRNPVLTHRSLRRDSPINSTGHADLVQLSNGDWWAVLLASRPDGGMYSNLGRETFAVPVTWEDGWPVFSPDTGRVEFTYPAPALPADAGMDAPVCDQFESAVLRPEWNFLRTPMAPVCSLAERPGWLRLYLNEHTLREESTPAFVGRRQQHMCFSARAAMDFTPDAHSRCGLALRMNDAYHLTLLHELVEGQPCVSLYRCFAGRETCLGRVPCGGSRVWFMIRARRQAYSFYVATEAEQWQAVAENVDGTLLSKEVAGGFTGAYIGFYGVDAAAPRGKHADFDWFEYQGIEL